ncbi:Uncharacterised protein [Kingella denitrificans]|uniref:Uncharacterized protein n=1 Tax=Kingella denitrificans ATCC 33394 TaxID=888741 RepID=F0F0P2_9NEIS|nr:hypothetical protein [Kingella denitrificans]EGC16874.1 hypothetical protein HMPREF9098_1677 [Kingella denitrificans ATCC 33394]QQB42193.1 hypothetical protein I6I17_01035 [Kingella denitrificans]STR11907.1 Uncharacterised protein [Kingella denitrificans]
MKNFIRTAASAVFLLGTLAVRAEPVPTPQQQQDAQKLTETAVQILDFGQFLGSGKDLPPWYELQPWQEKMKMTDEQFQCFKAKMTTSQGFREYKAEEALHYVQSRSPQELQQDFALLTPQTVQALSRLMSAFTQEDRSPGLSLQEVEKLQQDPPLFNAVDRFMSGEQHRDLRQLLLSLTFDNSPIENSAHSFQRYAFWSLKACHIPVE